MVNTQYLKIRKPLFSQKIICIISHICVHILLSIIRKLVQLVEIIYMSMDRLT